MDTTLNPVPTTPSTPVRSPILRPIALALLAALIMAGGLGLGPGRAEALTPGAPRILGPVGWDKQALVAWSLVDDGGKTPNSFQVERYLGNAAKPQVTYAPKGKVMSMVDSGLANGVTYRYRVRALNSDGVGPWSEKEAVQAKAGFSDLTPFTDSTRFVNQQFDDLLGRAPNPQELSYYTSQLDKHLTRTGNVIDILAHNPARVAERHPVLRLYFAFFERSPDPSGTTYWINQRKAGANLNTIASKFAGSSEFKNTYGSLSNHDFVQQIYLNVFHRQPDPSGLAYWAAKLDSHTKSRGQVMVGFSESSEYAGSNAKVGLSTGRVEASDIWLAMMKQDLSTQDLNTYYAPHIQRGGSQGILAMRLMPTTGYAKY